MSISRKISLTNSDHPILEMNREAPLAFGMLPAMEIVNNFFDFRPCRGTGSDKYLT